MNFYKQLRQGLISGFLVLVPIGAVAWIVVWLWTLLVRIVNIIPIEWHPNTLLEIQNPFASSIINLLLTWFLISLIVFFVWFVGVTSRNYLGRAFIEFIRSLVSRVPVLKTVYSTLEQLIETFATDKSKNFRRVVQIEYPRKGLTTLAFVTGERAPNLLTIYVPTTPNPTSGFYLTISEQDVVDVPLSVEEALKEVLSMGLVSSTLEKR